MENKKANINNNNINLNEDLTLNDCFDFIKEII